MNRVGGVGIDEREREWKRRKIRDVYLIMV
jgi:hypothetical protein